MKVAKSDTKRKAQRGKKAAPAPEDGYIEMIRAADLVEEPVLRWALQQSRLTGRAVCELLAEKVPAMEEPIYAGLAAYLGVGFERLLDQQADAELARCLDSHVGAELQVAPIRRENGQLVLVTCRPSTMLQVNRIATFVGGPVLLLLGPPSRVQKLIQGCYGLGAATVSKLLADGETTDDGVKLTIGEEFDIGEDFDSSQAASVMKLVSQIFVEAVKSGASDIHIEPFEKHLRVRFRLDGVLQEVPVPPAAKMLEQAIISRVKVLADMDIAERRLSQDGQLRLSVLGRSVDVRVSILPSIYGESLVLRILDRQSQYRELAEIGMPEGMLTTFRDVLHLAQGLVLVTGPTGSGKTTTLYASLNYVNTPGRKIITIEDPVEYRLEGITQIQVREPIGLRFSNVLRNIVRHDPDVAMVGEIRDSETANMAVSAAITGHLVLATVHTNDAPTAIARLTSMGTPAYMIGAALKVVLGQRLARVLCPECRRPEDDIPPDVLQDFPRLAGQQVFQATGCEECRHTGYRGRTAFYECLTVTENLAGVISGGGSTEIRQMAIREGMVPLRQAGLELVLRGVTTIDELYRITREVSPASTPASAPAASAGES